MAQTSITAMNIRDALDAYEEAREDDLGEAVLHARSIARQADELVEVAVRRYRSSGATWEQVAAAMNVSRQAAWERFGSR